MLPWFEPDRYRETILGYGKLPGSGMLTAADATIPLWVTDATPILAGVGIGAILSSAISFLSGSRQRRHDAAQRDRDHRHELSLRQQQFEHEIRLDDIRDRQQLRDARLERLR